MLAVGPIPEGLDVLHKCDNPPCVNPEHLFLGTHTDNMQDMVRKGRHKTKRGSENSRSKLTEQKVKDILRMSRDGWKGKTIAARYGVTPTSVSLILSGKTWQHVNRNEVV